MKRLVYAIAFAATLLLSSSCEEVNMDGAWDPIELDKSHVNFPKEGGQNTISALNYTRWWINGGYESSPLEYTHATSSDGEEVHTYDLLDGGWYHILVPDKGKSNTVIITVDPHDDTKPRQATIQMQAGNAFTTFTISQP